MIYEEFWNLEVTNKNEDPGADSEPTRKMSMKSGDVAALQCSGYGFPGYPPGIPLALFQTADLVESILLDRPHY